MSHVALQRVMVRMLYDPDLATRVRADPLAALPDADLTDRERSWLTAPDPRAWTADPDRGARSLTVLVQQFPASMALAFRSVGSLAPFLDYFRSKRFHRCIQDGGSMALEFAEHLVDLAGRGTVPDARVSPLARLEQAIARLQRTAPARAPRTGVHAAAYRLSPDRDLMRAPSGTAALHAAVHRALASLGIGLTEAVLDDRWPVPRERVRPGRREPLLLELFRDDGPRVRFGVGVSGITGDLHALLDYARAPRSRSELVDRTVSLGAGRDEAGEIVDGLVGDGVLVPGVEP